MSSPTVLITGANRGLGLALAQRYLNHGYDVIAGLRDRRTPGELAQLGAITPAQLDLGVDAQIEQLGCELSGRALDVLIHNAGAAVKERGLESLAYGNWEGTLRVNAYALLKLAQVFKPHLMRGRQKKLILIGSEMGSIAQVNSGARYAYRASKAAANMLIKILSVELAHDQFNVVSIHPGWVRTRLGGPEAQLTPDESAAALYQLIARLTPEDSGRFLDANGADIPW